MSGYYTTKGIVLQPISALLSCLENEEWTDIKLEPGTAKDKVDYILYKNQTPIHSVQVKSSINTFYRDSIESWMNLLCADEPEGTHELILIGEKYSKDAEEYIKKINKSKDKKITPHRMSFEDLLLKEKGYLGEYVEKHYPSDLVMFWAISIIHDRLFSALMINGAMPVKYSRKSFINVINGTLQQYVIHGRNDIKGYYRSKHLSATENSDIPFEKNPPLFEIIDAFVDYEWNSIVRNLLDDKGEIIYQKTKTTKDEVFELLLGVAPFANRLSDFRTLVHNGVTLEESEETKVKSFMENLSRWSFGNCLFIRGKYGIGKTRLLKNLEINSDPADRYVCYLDLIDVNGQLDEQVINDLIRRYFGDTFENIELLLTFFSENGEKQKIILMIDNLDFAFSCGLQPKKLYELIESYSICDQLKWIFTMQSEQNYIVWSNREMDKLAANYGFVPENMDNEVYFSGLTLDMDAISYDGKVFESILRTANLIDSSEDINLRINHEFDAYLTPYVAELLIRLRWTWETILNAKTLVYLDLCQNYKEKKIENLSEFNVDDIPAIEREMEYKNLCISIGLYQLDNGLSKWGKDDNVVCAERSLAPLVLEDLVKITYDTDSYGRISIKYEVFDYLFWAEQNAQNMLNRTYYQLEEKLKACIRSAESSITNLPYFPDMQRLYYLKLFQEENIFKETKFESEGTLSKDINILLSTQIYQAASEALSLSDQESQKKFLEVSLNLLKGFKKNKLNTDQLDPYIFLSSFFGFCSVTKLSVEDWKKLVSSFPTQYTELQMKNIVNDFKVLLWKKRSELKGDLLGLVLAYLGNEDAEVFKPVARTISDIYLEDYPDRESLIKTLLNDKKLNNLGKRYVPSKRLGKQTVKNNTVIVTSKTFPYCLAESAISEICDRIIEEKGIINGYGLFWKNGWYAENLTRDLPFYVELRRKSLNLALTNYARNNNNMKDLEKLISCCWNQRGDRTLGRFYKEETLYLCRNSVRAEDTSPEAYSPTIYEYLVGFVTDSDMEYWMNRQDVINYYAKHKIFALFNHCNVSIKLRKEEIEFECHIDICEKDKITVKTANGKLKTIGCNEIERLSYTPAPKSNRSHSNWSKSKRNSDRQPGSRRRN